METLILAALIKDRKFYETFERLGDFETFEPIGRIIGRAIQEYYSADPNIRSIDRSLITERLLSRITNPKHREPIKRYLEHIPCDVSAPNILGHLQELRQKKIGTQLSLALANQSPPKEIAKLIQEYSHETPEGVEILPDLSLVDVLDVSDLTEGEDAKSDIDYIKLWPKQLNDCLDGGALKGHHVLAFGRPEIGKTAFSINLCAGFLKQNRNVLYVANEEPTADIRDRLRGRLLETDKGSIRRSPKDSAAKLSALHLGTIRILETTNFTDVRSTLLSADKGQKWDVVLCDQLRNMRLKSDSRTAELEAAGIEARAIAKEFKVLFVSITQAGDSATNKVYLEMNDVDSSKTGLPASADLMIGLGSNDAMKRNGLMGIGLCKNKLAGSHDNFTVSVNFQTGVLS